MKQTPRLLRSGLTGAIYIVTKYEERRGGNQFVAEEKFDVTEEFHALVAAIEKEESEQ